MVRFWRSPCPSCGRLLERLQKQLAARDEELRRLGREIATRGASLERKAMILLVDDDDAVRDSTAMLLRGEGYEVEAARHGRDALERLRGGLRPSLVLLDLMMPVMDGYEFLGRKARDPELRAIPVVIVSATSDRAPAAPCVRGVMSKPVDFDDLLAEVRRHEAAGVAA